MSNIPSSAMPHAKASEGSEQDSKTEQGSEGPTISERAGKLREQAGDYARENPKTAIAAGAALAAGVIAAAVVPLVRGRSSSGESKKSGGSGAAKKTTASKSTTTKKS